MALRHAGRFLRTCRKRHLGDVGLEKAMSQMRIYGGGCRFSTWLSQNRPLILPDTTFLIDLSAILSHRAVVLLGAREIHGTMQQFGIDDGPSCPDRTLPLELLPGERHLWLTPAAHLTWCTSYAKLRGLVSCDSCVMPYPELLMARGHRLAAARRRWRIYPRPGRPCPAR